MKIRLSAYDLRDYHPGAGLAYRTLWYIANAVLFDSWFHVGSRLKCSLLRLFGARIGRRVVIKPRVNIKYPWHLEIGNDVWIGEGVWLDNLAKIIIGSNVCISQDSYLLTGNHDYTDPAFGLIVKEITVGEGVWVGARAVVCPGVRLERNAVLTAGSVLTGDAVSDGIYRGNPARHENTRSIRDTSDS